MKPFLILAMILATQPATADWVSAGGNLILDSQNPWFIQNTKVVRYCIERDPANFDAEFDNIQTQVRSAFAYWVREGSDVQGPTYWPGQEPIKIATQNFIEEQCNNKTDIRFQMGFLSDQQLKSLGGDVRDIAGVAVRTAYDRVNLRGKGFVYIAPDSGPNRFRGFTTAKPWRVKSGALLYNMLIHELGHVFGLPHITTDSGLMRADFAEKLMIRQQGYDPRFIGDFFKFRGTYRGANSGYHNSRKVLAAEVHEFFNLRPNTNGVWLRTSDKNTVIVDAATGDTVDNMEFYQAGTIALKRSDTSQTHIGGVNVYLPKEQAVYKLPASRDKIRHLPGPQVQIEKVEGEFVSADGKVTHDLVLDLTQMYASWIVSGVIDGKLKASVITYERQEK